MSGRLVKAKQVANLRTLLKGGFAFVRLYTANQVRESSISTKKFAYHRHCGEKIDHAALRHARAPLPDGRSSADVHSSDVIYAWARGLATNARAS